MLTFERSSPAAPDEESTGDEKAPVSDPDPDPDAEADGPTHPT